MSGATQVRKLITSARSKARVEARVLSTDDSFDLEKAGRRLGLTQEQLACALNLPARSLRHSNAGREPSQTNQRIRDLRELLSQMNDYVVTSEEKQWLVSPLAEFGGRSPRELIIDGQIRDPVIEFDKLRDGQPV